MQPLELLQNIPIDNTIRAALDNNRDNPIFPGPKGVVLSCAEFVFCLFLSLSPSWNTDLYIKAIYHFLFKQQLLDAIRARDERLLHEQDMLARQAEQKEENEGASDTIPRPSDQEPAQPNLMEEEEESMPRNRLTEEPMDDNSDIQVDEKGDFPQQDHLKLE